MKSNWYEKKRDEMYNAYQAALERNETEQAQRLYREYETYAKQCGGES